jgi:hypothetical protein
MKQRDSLVDGSHDVNGYEPMRFVLCRRQPSAGCLNLQHFPAGILPPAEQIAQAWNRDRKRLHPDPVERLTDGLLVGVTAATLTYPWHCHALP